MQGVQRMHFTLLALSVIALSGCSFLLDPFGSGDAGSKTPTFSVTSTAFADGKAIPVDYTCDGENVHPPLRVAGLPEGTRSIAFILEEPSASDAMRVRWILWNVEPPLMEIAEGDIPAGATQGRTSAGSLEYEGPCPEGESTYVFRAIALDMLIDASSEADLAFLVRSMEGHMLGNAVLLGTYRR